MINSYSGTQQQTCEHNKSVEFVHNFIGKASFQNELLRI